MEGRLKIPVAILVVLIAMASAVLGQAAVANHLRLTVTDEKGGAVPDAKCVLLKNTKPLTEVQTGPDGIAIFTDIPTGSYDLRIEKDGFKKYEQSAIGFFDGTTSEITVNLTIGSLSVEVSVESESDRVNTVESGATLPSANIQGQAIARLPLASKRVDQAIPLVPGVIRTSTGEISINGATEQQSSFRVNGLNVADPTSGNFRLNLPVDAVESVQVFRHPYSAEYGQFTGGVTEIETKRGGEKWHFEINDFLPDLRFVEGHIVGIADDSPHLNFNGPIIKKKLYISTSLGYSISKTPVRGLVFPNNETISETQSGFTQFDLHISERHTAAVTLGYFPERDSFVGLDFFRPRSVTPNYKQRDGVVTVRDNYAFLGGSLLQSSASYKYFDARVWGQGTADQNLTPTGEFGNFFASRKRYATRLELFEVFSLSPRKIFYGTHNIKFGFNFTNVKARINYQARPVNVFRANGTLAEKVTTDPSVRFSPFNHTYTGFVQDRWLLRPNLSIDIGARFEDQRIAHERTFSPRAGFAWSPFTGDKTLIRGGFGFFYDKVPLNIRAFNRYPQRTVSTYGVDGITLLDETRYENVLVDDATLIPLDFRTARTRVGFVPQNLNLNIQIDQIITSYLSLRADFTRSSTNHIYIVQPQTDFFGRKAIVLTPSGQATYDAFELTAKLTLPKSQPVFISYVRSKARGDLNDFNTYFGYFGEPLIRQNQYSNLPTDVPNRLLAWGTFNLPHKITLSPILEWRSGFPYSVLNEAQNFVGLRNSSATRFPAFFSLDAEIAKDFQVTKKYAVRLSLKGFNLTNHFNPRNVRNNLGDPQFGTFLNNYRRYFSGGFDIIF